MSKSYLLIEMETSDLPAVRHVLHDFYRWEHIESVREVVYSNKGRAAWLPEGRYADDLLMLEDIVEFNIWCAHQVKTLEH